MDSNCHPEGGGVRDFHISILQATVASHYKPSVNKNACKSPTLDKASLCHSAFHYV